MIQPESWNQHNTWMQPKERLCFARDTGKRESGKEVKEGPTSFLFLSGQIMSLNIVIQKQKQKKISTDMFSKYNVKSPKLITIIQILLAKLKTTLPNTPFFCPFSV